MGIINSRYGILYRRVRTYLTAPVNRYPRYTITIIIIIRLRAVVIFYLRPQPRVFGSRDNNNVMAARAFPKQSGPVFGTWARKRERV